MNTLTKHPIVVRNRGQVTIPQKVAKKYGIHEGSYLELVERKGEFALRPRVMIDPEQAWFWTPEWQKKEREADADVKAGRVYGPYKNADDLIADLNRPLREIKKDTRFHARA